MFKKMSATAVTIAATLIALAASAGIGTYCWGIFYQPEPPK